MKKGITIIATTTAIIIITIFVSVTVISAKSIIDEFAKSKFVTELINIQDTVFSFKSEKGIYPIKEKITVNLSSVSETALKQFASEETIENKINLYTIDLDLINLKTTLYGNGKTENDKYLLSEDTGKVYYLEGISYKYKKYYTFHEDILKSFKNVDSLQSNDIKRFDTIFSLSNIEYTKEGISVDVKIPISAEFISVTATNSMQVGTENIENIYKKITVNSTKLNGNYKINVEYEVNGYTKSVWYMVDNFDNLPPEITIGGLINSSNEAGNLKTYLTNIKALDLKSGVKKIKYEFETITDYKYFENYGYNLKDDKIDITGKTVCTIYTIDNAGNQVIENISLD